MKQRTITAEIVLPEWAKWMAIESNGERWVYDVMPVYDDDLGCWNTDCYAEEELLYTGNPVTKYKESRIKL